jgi:hypothetical protein
MDQQAHAITDLPLLRPVPGHHRPAPFYLTADMYGGLPVEIAGGDISDKVGAPVADPHRHTVPEIYLLVSPSPGGARIRVTVDEREFEVGSPATVYVPAGARHQFLTLAAEPGSYCFGVLLGGSA